MADVNEEQARWAAVHVRVVEQEKLIGFERFDYDDAWAVGSTLVAAARDTGLPIVVSIVFGEQRVFHAAVAGSTAVNDDWVGYKINTVRRHNLSSYGVGSQYRSEGRDFDAESRYDNSRYAAAGGAVPIRVAGSLIGVIGISGLPEADDHQMVVDALASHRSRAIPAELRVGN
ncbi:hypothetical protein CH300_25535 [Rhodococcus sp. 15-1154-1]|nr:heme-degrading domain-containing protein [Rhodococcus sp. 15-1154-1]OZE97553.1 hypothetical protein CH300_25535 [Rhodococcus sp. 15-1154-1]